jgi:hypothetical protein
MQKVEDLDMQVSGLLMSLEQKSCWLLSSYQLVMEVDEMLCRVQRLDKEKKSFGDI